MVNGVHTGYAVSAGCPTGKLVGGGAYLRNASNPATLPTNGLVLGGTLAVDGLVARRSRGRGRRRRPEPLDRRRELHGRVGARRPGAVVRALRERARPVAHGGRDREHGRCQRDAAGQPAERHDRDVRARHAPRRRRRADEHARPGQRRVDVRQRRQPQAARELPLRPRGRAGVRRLGRRHVVERARLGRRPDERRRGHGLRALLDRPGDPAGAGRPARRGIDAGRSRDDRLADLPGRHAPARRRLQGRPDGRLGERPAAPAGLPHARQLPVDRGHAAPRGGRRHEQPDDVDVAPASRRPGARRHEPHGSARLRDVRRGTPVPSVATGAAVAITDTSATLAGTVNPSGSFSAYVFEYGPTLSFGSITTPAGAGSGGAAAPVGATLTSLAPNTTYYYRLVATNAAGTSIGAVRSFRTTGPPQPPIAITGAATDVTRRPPRSPARSTPAACRPLRRSSSARRRASARSPRSSRSTTPMRLSLSRRGSPASPRHDLPLPGRRDQCDWHRRRDGRRLHDRRGLTPPSRAPTARCTGARVSRSRRSSRRGAHLRAARAEGSSSRTAAGSRRSASHARGCGATRRAARHRRRLPASRCAHERRRSRPASLRTRVPTRRRAATSCFSQRLTGPRQCRPRRPRSQPSRAAAHGRRGGSVRARRPPGPPGRVGAQPAAGPTPASADG